MIRAICQIPAYDSVRFDATPWFEEASPRAIVALVREEWTGRPARDMAKALTGVDGYSRLGDILAYKRRRRIDPVDGKGLVIEIHVDPEDALAWLAAERPHVRATITAEYGDDALVCDSAKASWADQGNPDESDYLRRTEAAPAAVGTRL